MGESSRIDASILCRREIDADNGINRTLTEIDLYLEHSRRIEKLWVLLGEIGWTAVRSNNPDNPELVLRIKNR